MTITELDTSTIEDMEFAIMCDMRPVLSKKRCENEAFAVVKIKCARCEKVVDPFMCVKCLDNAVRFGVYHAGACNGMAWYITHQQIK